MSYQISLWLLGAAIPILVVLCIAGSRIVRNVFIRLIWLVQKPFKSGDFVEVGEISGKIVQIGWQGVSLESEVGDYVLISNCQVWKKPIKRKQSSSGSHGVEIRLPWFVKSDGATARLAANACTSTFLPLA